MIPVRSVVGLANGTKEDGGQKGLLFLWSDRAEIKSQKIFLNASDDRNGRLAQTLFHFIY